MIDRNQNILHLLVVENLSNEVDLKKRLDISQRQLDYSMLQINQQLEDAKMSPIEIINGTFVYSDELRNILLLQTKARDVVLSVENRHLLIPFSILIRSEELSLDHLAFILGVSKNTVLKDLKKSSHFIEEFNLKIEYSRKDGYFIYGDEWDKRIVLKKLSDHFYNQYGDAFIIDLLADGKHLNEQVNSSISEAEKILNFQFTDDDYYYLTIFITAILVRIKQGNTIKLDADLELIEIKNTDHYRVVEYVFRKFQINQEEVVYFTMYLLGSKSRVISSPQQINLPKLSQALWEFLGSFEENTLLVLVDKHHLHEKLLNHFKPAYYRIKYNLKFENVLYEHIIKKYSVLHQFVKQSITPLELFFNEEIDEHEISYITLFVGGHLFDAQGNKYESLTVNAVIVCPSGISMSRLIEKEIKGLFPEFQFYQPISLREYESFLLPHNIVFSTVPLKSSQRVYFVQGIMDLSEKINLRRRVIGELYDLNFETIDINKSIEIIKKYVDIKDEEKLKNELLTLMIPKGVNIDNDFDEKSSLIDMISKDSILIENDEISWDEALEKLGRNLMEQDLVSEDFIQELHNSFSNQPENIMLKQKVLIPHLDPSRVEQSLGISILVSKQGIQYNNKNMNIVIGLTTPNKIDHLNILMNIRDISMNDSLIDKLKDCNNEEEVYQLLIEA